MKIITFDDVKALGIDPRTCYKWASDMILKKEETFLPPKTHMNLADGVFWNIMPSMIYLPDQTWGGVKIVNRYPDKKPALDSKIMLFDVTRGEFLALMDGNWITAMRTGAVAVHSIIQFANQGFTEVGMLGLGNIARTTMLVLAAMVTDRVLHVKLLRYKDQAELFIERFSDCKNIEFSIVDTIEECIRGSEVVISCATYFANDIAEDDWFDEGVLVVPVHTRGFTNCDLFFDKVFADDTGHVNDFRNFSKFRYYAEVSDVVNGRACGRENEKERILAYNIGLSIHDINYARQIYDVIMKDREAFARLGDVQMHDPEEKFWV